MVLAPAGGAQRVGEQLNRLVAATRSHSDVSEQLLGPHQFLVGGRGTIDLDGRGEVFARAIVLPLPEAHAPALHLRIGQEPSRRQRRADANRFVEGAKRVLQHACVEAFASRFQQRTRTRCPVEQFHRRVELRWSNGPRSGILAQLLEHDERRK